jgi:TonB family protein
MAVTEIPGPAVSHHSHATPVLLLQLQDDLARSRLREAFWISILFHLLMIIAVVTAPKWVPGRSVVAVRTPAEMLQDRELTFLELPRDEQKVTRRPDTNIISDKDRIASSRNPTIDRKTLDELRDSRLGSPGPPPQVAQVPPVPPPVARSQGSAPPPPQSGTEAARLETPALGAAPGGAFTGGMSPGTAIEQAARAAAANRGGYGGAGGDYGLGTGSPRGGIKSNLDILSDTMGVDFGPYLSRVLHDVRLNWYNLIPEIARAPMMKKGKVSIQFIIRKDGAVDRMWLATGSGDVALDRAAWGGITGSNPFPPLPAEFRGPFLALQFHFYYNPDRGELQ